MMVEGVSPGAELSDWFVDFYDKEYREDILELARSYPRDKKSLHVEYDDLFRRDSDVALDWLEYPDRVREAAEDALALYDIPVDIDLDGAHVRLTDSMDAIDNTSVADLDDTDIGEFRAVHGVLDRVTKKMPRIDEAVFICQRCGAETVVPQSRSGFQDPYQCESCERQGPFELDASQSEFVSIRQVKLSQPADEHVQEGGEPKHVLVYVEDDLVDVGGENGLSDRAGEQVTVLGPVRLAEGEMSSRKDNSVIFDVWMEARAIEFDCQDYGDVDVDEYDDDIEELQKRAGDDLIEAYRDSIVPSLHADEKLESFLEAAVAWLFNGYRIDPDDGPTYRGDIHMALIGDPGLGKSTILQRLAEIAPKSEFRSGTGLSAVGLTAAAVQEEFAGKTEWTLQPGVLPRANGGHCIIDEVDDVVDDQTKKMHDALEGEQMVKVDKAGIHADLPTRAALLVSGNPDYGRFEKYESVPDQIDLDPALISRMDVLMALRDIPDPEHDGDVADHVLDSWDEGSLIEKSERVSGITRPDETSTSTTSPEIQTDVFRAAIVYSRENIFPELNEPVKEILKEYYIDVRSLNDGDDAPVPATPRTLEAGIRLATAFARAEFCEEIKPRHARRAISISEKVVGMSHDPETGDFDVDIIETGTPKSQRDRIKSIKSIIGDLEQESNSGAPVDEVLDRAEEAGIERSKAKHEIESLKQKGEIYNSGSDSLRVS